MGLADPKANACSGWLFGDAADSGEPLDWRTMCRHSHCRCSECEFIPILSGGVADNIRRFATGAWREGRLTT
jgi:hypothetical protein